MNTPTKIKLPKTLCELRECIRASIKLYQGTPVKNENKLNDALAAGLTFNSYESLIELSDLIKKHRITYDDHSYNYVIDDTPIEQCFFSEELFDYYLIDTEEEINNLYTYISECDHTEHGQTNKLLMIQTQDFLKSIDDEFVFSAINDGTDKVSASNDPERFNNICENLLAAYEKYKTELLNKS